MSQEIGPQGTPPSSSGTHIGTVLLPRTHEEFAVSISERQWKSLKTRIRTADFAGGWDVLLLGFSTTFFGIAITTLLAYAELPVKTLKHASSTSITPLTSDVTLVVGLAALALSAITFFFWWRMSDWRKTTLKQIAEDMENYEPPAIGAPNATTQTPI